jgi:hypothetical protein
LDRFLGLVVSPLHVLLVVLVMAALYWRHEAKAVGTRVSTPARRGAPVEAD